MEPLVIDGSIGEGGGQVLRTSLALSLVTGRPFRMSRIRAGRRNPGLRAQHIACVRAAAEVGDADISRASIGSMDLRFTPAKPRPGDYSFQVGTAGRRPRDRASDGPEPPQTPRACTARSRSSGRTYSR